MRTKRIGVVVGMAAVLGVVATSSRDADACGACFAPPTDSTQVSGHRMILSLSKQQTTLYDQLQYSGAPSSFAWVLPIRGQVEVGLSTELLFQTLDAQTTPQVIPPPYTCPPPPDGCMWGGAEDGAQSPGAGGTGGSGGASADAGAVNVISQETVGPYATVQLSATDPQALETWLAQNGYAIPNDMKPVIAAYLSEGFDFLALKLVPGAGVDRMRPVKVTTSGAAPSLPLRMVAGGVGAVVPITLWVVGEGPWETANFPTFRVDPAQIVWDFDAYASNYTTLRDQGYQATNRLGWLDQVSIPFSPFTFESQVQQYVTMGNQDYATGDDGGTTDAQAAASADLATLFAGMEPTTVRVTRLRAELPRAALSKDLELKASTDATPVPVVIQATRSTGKPPCPDYSWCQGNGGAGAGIPVVPNPFGYAVGDPESSGSGSGGSSSCSLGRGTDGSGAFAALALALGASLARRRRR